MTAMIIYLLNTNIENVLTLFRSLSIFIFCSYLTTYLECVYHFRYSKGRTSFREHASFASLYQKHIDALVKKYQTSHRSNINHIDNIYTIYSSYQVILRVLLVASNSVLPVTQTGHRQLNLFPQKEFWERRIAKNSAGVKTIPIQNKEQTRLYNYACGQCGDVMALIGGEFFETQVNGQSGLFSRIRQRPRVRSQGEDIDSGLTWGWLDTAKSTCPRRATHEGISLCLVTLCEGKMIR